MTFETKEDAFDALEQARAEWLAKARATAETLGRLKGVVTVDDVRAECPPPAAVDPRVMGAIFRGDQWEADGYVRSTRRECHKRPIAQFRWVG